MVLRPVAGAGAAGPASSLRGGPDLFRADVAIQLRRWRQSPGLEMDCFTRQGAGSQ